MKPAIRLFISSTFLDTQEERYIINQQIVPAIKEKCEEYGISFYAIDLRWGITKQDQLDDNVVSICLNEIDNCIPFFLGLIGNRYGWIAPRYNEKVLKQFPWIKDHQGKSVTELEMILGAIDNPDKDHSIFMYKDPCLFDKATFDDHQKEIDELKNVIDQKKIFHYTYKNLSEFREVLLKQLDKVISTYLTASAPIYQIRQEYFVEQVNKNFVSTSSDKVYLQMIDEITAQNKPAIIYAPHNTGVTTALTHIFGHQDNCLLINLEADTRYYYYFIHEYYLALSNFFKKNNLGELYMTLNDCLTYDVSCIERNLARSIKQGIENIKTNEPIYLVINDIDLAVKNDPMLFYFSLFPTELPPNVHLIISTSSEVVFDKAHDFVTCKLKQVGTIGVEVLKHQLAYYGKKLDKEVNALYTLSGTSENGVYPIIGKFVINFSNFDTHQDLFMKFFKAKDTNSAYLVTYNCFQEMCGTNEKMKVMLAFYLLRLSNLPYGLSEYELVQENSIDTFLNKIIKHFSEIEELHLTGLESATVMGYVHFFCDLKQDCFILTRDANQFVNTWKEDLVNTINKYLYNLTFFNVKNNISELKFPSKIKSGEFMSQEEILETYCSSSNLSRDLDDCLYLQPCLNIIKGINNYFKDKDDEYFENKELISFDNRGIVAKIQQVYILAKNCEVRDIFTKLFNNTKAMIYLFIHKKSLLFKLIDLYFKQVLLVSSKRLGVEVIKEDLDGIFKVKIDEGDLFKTYHYQMISECLRVFEAYEAKKLVYEAFNIEVKSNDLLEYEIGCYGDKVKKLYSKTHCILNSGNLSNKHIEALGREINILDAMLNRKDLSNIEIYVIMEAMIDILHVLYTHNLLSLDKYIEIYNNYFKIASSFNNVYFIALAEYHIGVMLISCSLGAAINFLKSSKSCFDQLGEIQIRNEIRDILKVLTDNKPRE